MSKARENVPTQIGEYEVLAVRDYKNDVRKDIKTLEESSTGLPCSNVLYYELNDNAWCCVRPSGTEPKIKFYFGVKGDTLENAESKLAQLSADTMKLFE